jgi:hypothetical protein
MDYPKDKIKPDKEYYSITLSASEDGRIELNGFTVWIGYADDEHKIELRKLDLIKADKMADSWIEWGMPFCVVNKLDDFVRWYFTGGHALIEKDIANRLMSQVLAPSASVKLSNKGFTSIALLSKDIFKKAPSPKKRMAILKRDKYRCKVCGRSPHNHVDIEIHVHHIRPFGERGLTHEENLISLCDTCHRGLEPHYEWSLYELLDAEKDTDNERQEYLEEVKQYREARKNYFKD